jgi:hypothetical protein
MRANLRYAARPRMSFGGPALLLQHDRRRQPLDDIDFGYHHLVEKPPAPIRLLGGPIGAIGRFRAADLARLEEAP